MTTTFGERIQDRQRRWWTEGAAVAHKSIAGKLEGRAFAGSLGCRLPDLYSVSDSIDELPLFSTLPARFVIKPTRGWSAKGVFALDNGVNLFDGKIWDREAIIRQLSEVKSQTDLSSIMYDCRSGFMVEELLESWDHKPGIPLDYKFYAFGSRIAFIHIIERNSNARLSANRHWLFDEHWVPLQRQVVRTQALETNPLPAPDCLAEMVGMVKRMGSALGMFMRIDMYATTRGAVFGEFTPTPHGGKGFTPWADEWMGGLWQGVEGVA